MNEINNKGNLLTIQEPFDFHILDHHNANLVPIFDELIDLFLKLISLKYELEFHTKAIEISRLL